VLILLKNNIQIFCSILLCINIPCGFFHHRIVTVKPFISLNIESNSFYGSKPNELSRLYRLQHLKFQFTTSVEKSRHGFASYENFKICLERVTVSHEVFHHLCLIYIVIMATCPTSWVAFTSCNTYHFNS
jgi:hypothetical protein